MGLPLLARKVFLPWIPVELELTVKLEWAVKAWLTPTVREPFPPGTGKVSGHEFWDQSGGSISFGSWGHCGCQSSWKRFTAELVCRGLTWRPPRGMDRSGQDQTPSAHRVMATDGADTTDRGSSVNQMHGTVWASGTAGMDQADTVWVVSMATHHRQYGVTVPSDHKPVTATSTAACYPELLHWREFRSSHDNSTSSAYSVSSWQKYGGAPCFRTDYGEVAWSIQHDGALCWHGCAV